MPARAFHYFGSNALVGALALRALRPRSSGRSGSTFDMAGRCIRNTVATLNSALLLDARSSTSALCPLAHSITLVAMLLVGALALRALRPRKERAVWVDVR